MPREHPKVSAIPTADITLPDGFTYTTDGTIHFTDRKPGSTDDGTATLVNGESGEAKKEIGFAGIVPVIECAIGYDSDDQDGEFDGVLLVVRKVPNALAMEIWRRDMMSEDVFTKLGTIDVSGLQAETIIFKNYVMEAVPDFNIDDCVIFYDNMMDSVKNPSMFQYKVRWLNFPTSLDFTLEDIIDMDGVPPSELQLNQWDLEGDTTVLEHISLVLYDTIGADWVIGMLNPEINYFTEDQEEILKIIQNMQFIKVAKNLDDVIWILKEMIMKFGVVAVIEKIFSSMGHLSEDFLRLLVNALLKSYNALSSPPVLGGDAMKIDDFSYIFKSAFKKATTPVAPPVSIPPIIPGGGL